MSQLGRRLAVVEAFRKLVKRAHKEGMIVVADSDSVGVRFLLDKKDEGDNLQEAGVLVRVDNACGGSRAGASGFACNYGVK